ncbi:MAG: hypothetical protein E7618_00490 [Ruminococcaceae bacterium]|nr:hypothetical protein [Oscillospiraceae bacterium]
MKRWTYRLPILLGAASLVLGFVTPWVWYLLPDNIYHPGFILSTLFWLTVMLTLYNITFVFTRPDAGERDTALRIAEVVGLLLGGFCYHTVMMLRHDLTGFDYGAAFADGRIALPFSLTAVWCLLLLSLVGYVVLRFVPCEAVTGGGHIAAIAAALLGIFLLVLLSLQWGKESIVTHLFHGNSIVILGRAVTDRLYVLSRHKRLLQSAERKII